MIELRGGPGDGEIIDAPICARILIAHWAQTEDNFSSFGEAQIHAYDHEGNYLGEEN